MDAPSRRSRLPGGVVCIDGDARGPAFFDFNFECARFDEGRLFGESFRPLRILTATGSLLRGGVTGWSGGPDSKRY